MKIQLIFIALVIGLACAEPAVEEGVYVLTEDNFEETLGTTDHVLVMFYAPWCGHCKRMKPEYAKAAQTLAAQGSEVKLAKVDATVETALAQKFGVRGYPTLKFYINGEGIDYQGGREEAGIIQWIKKKTSPSTTLLADRDGIEKAKSDNEVVVVFFGDEGSGDFGVWSKLTLTYDDLTFHHVFDSYLATIYDVEGRGVVLFKQFDEGRNDFDTASNDFTVDGLKNFVDLNKNPTIMKFEQNAAQLIFGGPSAALFVFVGAEGDAASDAAMEQLREASTTLKGRIVMCYSGDRDGMDKTLQGRLDDYLGVSPETARPQAWIVNPQGQEIPKFQLADQIGSNIGHDFTALNLISFVEAFEAGTLKGSVKSEPIPESQDEPVIKVVALNWEEIVMDPTKDVLVKYYAPWCGHCKAMAPAYIEVAEAVASDPNLVIAEMDATANEVSGVAIQGFPTIKFYPADDKKAVDYPGESPRDAPGFFNWLADNTSAAVTFDFSTVGVKLPESTQTATSDDEDDEDTQRDDSKGEARGREDEDDDSDGDDDDEDSVKEDL